MQPIFEVQRSQVTHYRALLYTTEASTIGLKPGEWPEQIRISGPVPGEEHMTVDKTFVKWTESVNADNELVKVTYHCTNNVGALVVFND